MPELSTRVSAPRPEDVRGMLIGVMDIGARLAPRSAVPRIASPACLRACTAALCLHLRRL